MGLRIKSTPEAIGVGLVCVTGSWAPAGTGAVTTVRGAGFTVARTDVGVFTITFSEKFPSLVSANATAQLAAAADTQAQAGTYTAASKTLVVRTLTAGSEADIAANANNRVNFICWFRKTGVPKA